MGRGIRTVLVVAGIALVTGAVAQPRPDLPQVKIDRVDASDPARWRVYLSGLDDAARPLGLMDRTVALFAGAPGARVRTEGDEPVVRFASGAAGKGFSGTLEPLGKARDVRQAVVLVLAMHADVPREVAAQYPETVSGVLDGLRKDASVGVVSYGDSVQVLWSPDGTRGDVRDLNDVQNCLRVLRADAGRPRDDGAKGVACGRLFASPEDVKAKLRALPAPQGLFPRLLGVPETQAVLDEASRRGHDRLDAPHAGTEAAERLAEGALEAALRLLMNGSPGDAVREVVVLSDGRDGYLRIAELMNARAVKQCGGKGRKCGAGAPTRQKGSTQLDDEGGSKECAAEAIECTLPRVADGLRSREDVVRTVLDAILADARAAEVRVFTVALPGTDEVGRVRLAALAGRTGGTFRVAGSAAEMPLVGKAVGVELASEVVAKPGPGLDPGLARLLVAVVDRDLKSQAVPFDAGPRVWPLERPLVSARAFAIARLGHGWGPPAFWTVLVLAALMALLMAWMLGKTLWGLAKKAAGAVPKPKAPAVPKPKAMPKGK